MENQSPAQKSSNKVILGVVAVIAVLFLGVYLFGSKNSSQGGSSSMTPQPSVTMAPKGGSSELTSKRWTWVNTKMSDGTVVTPSKEGAFTSTFETDLSLLATTDCNSGHGSYVVGTDNSMAISQMATTMMFCEGSNEQIFYRDLGNVGSYKISDGQLWLMLKKDSGTMIFQ